MEMQEMLENVGRLFNTLTTTLLGKKEVQQDIKVEVVIKIVNRLNAVAKSFLKRTEGNIMGNRITNDVYR